MKRFSSFVNSMFVNKLVKRKLDRRNKNLQFKWKSVFMEIMPKDKANTVKVSLKITTQYCQVIFHEIFMKDNTEPN